MKAKDYQAVGKYVLQHGLRIELAGGGYVHFIDSVSGERSSILLSHIHAEVDELKKNKRGQ